MNLAISKSSVESSSVTPLAETRTRPRCAFTVDVEDYYQVDAFSDRISPLDWVRFPSRVVDSTWTILRLLRQHDVRGTFFVLGYVAHKHPELVRAIRDDGHEVGCHSYWHRPIHRLTPEEFREDLRQATEAIGELIGEPVTTFRAPTFSIRGDTLWALELLAEAGYRIDSSIFPVRHDKYGIPDADPLPHVRETASGSIWEFPPTVYRTRLGNVPIAGGGYFRLLPFAATRWMMSRVHLAEQQPLMFYIHPWEVDVNQPRLKGRWKSRFRHYQNLRTTASKLDRLLSTFSFGTMTEALDAYAVTPACQNQPPTAPGQASPSSRPLVHSTLPSLQAK